MAARPAAYASFRDHGFNITVDMRIHAPDNVPYEVMRNEAFHTYMELQEEIKRRWGDANRTEDDRPETSGSTG